MAPTRSSRAARLGMSGANRYTINQTLVVRSDDPGTVLSASAKTAEGEVGLRQ